MIVSEDESSSLTLYSLSFQDTLLPNLSHILIADVAESGVLNVQTDGQLCSTECPD